MFQGKKILITGGTGSLGQALAKRLLDSGAEIVRIFSRNESKQIEMDLKFNDSRLRFLLGDVRDVHRLTRATENIDYVFHAAALKHVPKIEYNPFEAINTNVLGSQNMIEACLHENVEKAICISTDKAVSPLNTYGATKLLMEKLFVTANNYLDPRKHKTKFITARYGNVFGSSGSVIPRFIEQIKNNQKITITDPNMTRFSITMEQALDFVLNAIQSGKGSEIFVPVIKSYSILTVRDALVEIFGNVNEETVGIRPGEKLHEILVNKEEMHYTWKYNNMYMITNPLYPLFNIDSIEKGYHGIEKIQNLGGYSSDKAENISKQEIVNTINKSGLL